MSKLAISALVIVAAVAVQGSLFGPFGPFGQVGVAAPPAFGPPTFAQPGFFPGYPSASAPTFPSFGPPSGFFPAPLASRALLPAGAVRPYPRALNDLLLNAALPADLREKANQLVVEYEQGNAACDATYVPFGPTASSACFCKVLNRVTVELAAKELELEANARAQLAAEQAAAAVAEAEQAAVVEEAAVATEEAEVVEEPAAVVVEEHVDAEELVVDVEVEEAVPTANEDVAVVVDVETTTAV